MTEVTPLSTEVLSNNRVLRIAQRLTNPFIETDDETPQIAYAVSHLIHLLGQHNFTMVLGDDFQDENELEVGIGLIDHNGNEEALNQALAREANVVMPQSFTWQEVLESNLSVVAKRRGAHAGEGKYLITTPEQKRRFILPHLIVDQSQQFYNSERPGSEEEITEEELNLVLSASLQRIQNYPFGLIHDEIDRSWVFQEVIDTPSNHYTSFRVLVDAWGHIQFGAMIISAHEKGTVSRTSTRELTKEELEKLPLEEFTDLEYRNPNNGFYLGSDEIVSYGNDSHEYILVGQSIDDPIIRDIFTAHGINPDAVLLPPNIAEAASRVGRALRPYYLFAGLDFLLDQKGNLYFLEANLPTPGLPPAALDLPEDATYEECYEALVNQIIQNS